MSQLINEKFEEMVAEMQPSLPARCLLRLAAPATQSKTAVNAKANPGDQTPGKLDPPWFLDSSSKIWVVLLPLTISPPTTATAEGQRH